MTVSGALLIGFVLGAFLGVFLERWTAPKPVSPTLPPYYTALDHIIRADERERLEEERKREQIRAIRTGMARNQLYLKFRPWLGHEAARWTANVLPVQVKVDWPEESEKESEEEFFFYDD